jgi:hypothetical protein
VDWLRRASAALGSGRRRGVRVCNCDGDTLGACVEADGDVVLDAGGEVVGVVGLACVLGVDGG